MKTLEYQPSSLVRPGSAAGVRPGSAAAAPTVFANIRTHKRLDRFTLRGKIKVNIQWLLYCMVHNMEKIANYGFT
jgi:hypothetical protein